MNQRPLPYRRPAKGMRERMHEHTEAAIADQPKAAACAEWYEEFAVELTRVQRGQQTISGTMRAVNAVRDKWLRRSLHWPTVARIMNSIVSLPFEMNPRTSG